MPVRSKWNRHFWFNPMENQSRHQKRARRRISTSRSSRRNWNARRRAAASAERSMESRCSGEGRGGTTRAARRALASGTGQGATGRDARQISRDRATAIVQLQRSRCRRNDERALAEAAAGGKSGGERTGESRTRCRDCEFAAPAKILALGSGRKSDVARAEEKLAGRY